MLGNGIHNVGRVKCRPLETGAREVFALFLFSILFSDYGALTVVHFSYLHFHINSLKCLFSIFAYV